MRAITVATSIQEDGRHIPQHGSVRQRTGLRERSCHRTILEHQSATDTLSAGLLAEERKNEVIVLDVLGPEGETESYGQNKPELDKLNIKHTAAENSIDLNGYETVSKGAFAAGNGLANGEDRQRGESPLSRADMQERTGTAGDVASIAELYFAGQQRQTAEPRTMDSEIHQQRGTSATVTTRATRCTTCRKTYWSTAKGTKYPHHRHRLGKEQTFSALEYLPRAEQGAPGSVKEYEIKVKDEVAIR